MSVKQLKVFRIFCQLIIIVFLFLIFLLLFFKTTWTNVKTKILNIHDGIEMMANNEDDDDDEQGDFII
jgi:cell division protein FtsL